MLNTSVKRFKFVRFGKICMGSTTIIGIPGVTKMNIRNIGKMFGALTLALFASSAFAGAVLDTGKVTMGVGDDGGLGTVGGVGLALTGGPGDAITPGCLCEGWGGSADGALAGYTYGGGSVGIASAVFTPGATADAATSVVTFTNGLVVTHVYSAVAGGTLFQIDVSMENTTGVAMTDVRYARTLDWDVPPGHFTDDFTTIYGGSAAGPAGDVLHTSFNPFDVPDPTVLRGAFGCAADTSDTDCTGDLGAYFILSFGEIAAGASHDFVTYIGADFTAGGLLAAFAAVGIEAYSYSFDNDGDVTYGWGFGDIGLPPALGVPEPGTLSLLGIGLLGAGLVRRRRRV